MLNLKENPNKTNPISNATGRPKVTHVTLISQHTPLTNPAPEGPETVLQVTTDVIVPTTGSYYLFWSYDRNNPGLGSATSYSYALITNTGLTSFTVNIPFYIQGPTPQAGISFSIVLGSDILDITSW